MSEPTGGIEGLSAFTEVKGALTMVNVFDDDKPAGGFAQGLGLRIDWQNGPLVVDGKRIERSGAFVEDLLIVAINRLEHYQDSPFACDDNAQALVALNIALDCLHHRTADREARGVEGTHEL